MTAVFAIGSNGSGQLGIGHKEDVSVPKQVIFHPEAPSTRIIKVAAGGNHTLLLSESGRLYWSGDPASGACGLGPPLNVPAFQEIRSQKEGEPSLGRISLVACTWDASFIVAEDGDGRKNKLYSLGSGMKGELGLGEFIVRTPSATLFKDFPPAGTEIVDLASCMGHVVAVLNDGTAYGWGNCRKSQIGNPGGVVFSPRKIEDDAIDFPISRAVCAKESTCVFGPPDSGKFHVLGSDKWTLRSSAPETSSLAHWGDVGSSWGGFYVLSTNGALHAWGRDDHGQLPPEELPRIRKAAPGSEHVVVLTGDGDVLAWGWGEHGNCGPKVENNDVKGRWNLIASSKFIPPDSRIDEIGAGCATSWICIASK